MGEFLSCSVGPAPAVSVVPELFVPVEVGTESVNMVPVIRFLSFLPFGHDNAHGLQMLPEKLAVEVDGQVN